jgi:signal transduction histidine kinase
MNNELDHSCGACTALSSRPSHSVVSETDRTPDARLETFAGSSMLGLDLGTLRRVSRTLGGEFVPATHVAQLLDTAIDITKATWGLVALLHEDGWEAIASASAPGAAGRPTPSTVRLPVAILTAAAHLRNGLTLHDVRDSDRWQADEYVCRHAPRSIACLPIRLDGTFIGALYLEHENVPGVFSPAHIALAEIVALQAGLALDNARLQEALCIQQATMRDTLSELDRASRLQAYGELAASIVHEVAQPVTALDTSARAGLKWLNRSTPNIEAAREMLAHICACAMRARTIISALRAKARQAPPAFVTLDLADILREAAEIVACTLDAMSVDLRLEGLCSSLPVSGERIQLQQAIISLLMNGAESMLAVPEHKRVLVLSCERMSDIVCVRIDDNGEGVDPRLARRIFEPLFTTKAHGMGMGLSICKSIVDAHHGRLELTARPQGGTRATIVLPLSAS